MPRFSKRRMRTRRTRRTMGTGRRRSRRGGEGERDAITDYDAARGDAAWALEQARKPENVPSRVWAKFPDNPFKSDNDNPYAYSRDVSGGKTKRKMRKGRSRRGGAVTVGNAFMYKDPITKKVQNLTVNEITGTNCWFIDNNGDKKNIDCDQLEENSVNPKQALANLQGLDRGFDTRDGNTSEFRKEQMYYKNGQYVSTLDDLDPMTSGGFKRIKRRKTQKRRRR